MEGLVTNTIATTGNAINNICYAGNASDGENFVNTGIATLTTLAGVKTAHTLLVKSGVVGASYKLGKEFAKTVISPFKMLYHATLGMGNERYEARRIKNDEIRKSRNRHNAELAKIDRSTY